MKLNRSSKLRNNSTTRGAGALALGNNPILTGSEGIEGLQEVRGRSLNQGALASNNGIGALVNSYQSSGGVNLPKIQTPKMAGGLNAPAMRSKNASDVSYQECVMCDRE